MTLEEVLKMVKIEPAEVELLCREVLRNYEDAYSLMQSISDGESLELYCNDNGRGVIEGKTFVHTSVNGRYVINLSDSDDVFKKAFGAYLYQNLSRYHLGISKYVPELFDAYVANEYFKAGMHEARRKFL